MRDDRGNTITDVRDNGHLVVQDKTELFYHVCCDCGNVHRVWIDWEYRPGWRARWEIPDMDTVPPATADGVRTRRRRFIGYIAQLAREGKTVDEIIDLTLNDGGNTHE